jgi:hypothetical protein
MLPPAMTADDDTSASAPPLLTLPAGQRGGEVTMQKVYPTMLSASLSEPTSLLLMSKVMK